jgi:DNA-binding transcriptional LysR family regulator
MIQSLELMSKFHAMCECDTWEEISKKLSQTRADVESVVSELELLLGKKLIHRRYGGDVVSNFSSRFFMPTDAGMKWYLLIGELLRGLGDASSPSFDKMAKGLFREFCQWRGEFNPELLLSTVISISFNGIIDMKNLKIYTSDFLSFCFLENVLAKLAQEHSIENFEILCSESDHLADFDAYFLAYQIHVKDFHHEVLHESRLGLYASSGYLERAGEPKKLEDLLDHSVIRCRDTHVVQALGVKKFGSVKEFVPLFYKDKYIEVDSANSQLHLGEIGLGLIPMTDLLYKKVNPKLLRIAPLEGEEEFVYRRHTFGYHLKHTAHPLIKNLLTELKDAIC